VQLDVNGKILLWFRNTETYTSYPFYVIEFIFISEYVLKAGDTLSSRHVSSCDVTHAVGM
jgi:hypothetical protein